MRIVIMPAMSFACSLASASINRASIPLATGTGSLRLIQICCATSGVVPSIAFVPAVLVGEPVVGMRGSFEDEKGSAFFSSPCVSKLSPTTKRARVDTWPARFHRLLSFVGCENVTLYV